MKRLIESTQFSMAHQDVRYYLNGMLFETEVLNAAGSVFTQPLGDCAA